MVIQALIHLAKELKDRAARSEEHGLTPDEVAYCDALAENTMLEEPASWMHP